MFKITVRKGLFGPSVSGLGNAVSVNNHVEAQFATNGKVASFSINMSPAPLLRALTRGGKVTHKENGMRYTFSPVYA